MTVVAFDIDTFADDSTPVRYEDLDMTVFDDDPLP